MLECNKFFEKIGKYLDETFNYYSSQNLNNFDEHFQNFFALYRSLVELKLVIISLTRIQKSFTEMPPEEYIEKIYSEQYFYLSEVYNNFINCLDEFKNKLCALINNSNHEIGPLSRMCFYEDIKQDCGEIIKELRDTSEIKELLTIRDTNHHFMRNIYSDNEFLEALCLLKDQAINDKFESKEIIEEFQKEKGKKFEKIITICEDSLNKLCNLLNKNIDQIISQPVKITEDYNKRVKVLIHRCVATVTDNKEGAKFFINDQPSTPEDIIQYEIETNIKTEISNQKILNKKKGR